MELEFHPIANCWRLIEGDDFDNLVQDIKSHGLHNPIVLYEDKILDGRNRYRACLLAGETPHFIAYGDFNDPRIKRQIIEDNNGITDYEYIIKLFDKHDGEDGLESDDCIVAKFHGPLTDPISFAKSLNDIRRHDNESQRSMTAAKLATLPKGVRSDTAMAVSVPTQDEAAKMMDVSIDSVQRARVVIDKGSDELIEAVELGQVSVRAASDIAATLPKPQQAQIVARGEKEILEAAKQIRAEKAEVRRAERIDRIVEIAKGNTDLSTDRKYPVIYADPPWRYDYAETENRAIENQYPTMSIDEICNMPVSELATDDAILFMWTTAPKLEEAFKVVSSWGFTYRSCAIWDKQKIGMGYYFRIQHEILLVATRGNIPTPAPADRVSSVISIPRSEHSVKPVDFYEIIEKFYPTLPKIELFCRSPREGWAVWGNQSFEAA